MNLHRDTHTHTHTHTHTEPTVVCLPSVCTFVVEFLEEENANDAGRSGNKSVFNSTFGGLVIRKSVNMKEKEGCDFHKSSEI